MVNPLADILDLFPRDTEFLYSLANFLFICVELSRINMPWVANSVGIH